MDVLNTLLLVVMAILLGGLGVIVYSTYRANQRRKKAINDIVRLSASLIKKRR